MCQVSVIIPNYNHARYLTKRIESVLNQTFPDFEVILLDDKSPDNSLEIIEKYRTHPKVSKIILNDTNSGSTFKQWNKGVAEAMGEWIWLAESDDYCDETFLEELLKVAKQNEKVGVVYCKSHFIDQDENKIHNPYADASQPEDTRFDHSFTADGRKYCQEHLLGPIIGNASSAIFKKDIFTKIGGADTTLLLCGDWKMWHELLLHTNIGYCPSALNYFRHHTNNVRSTKGAKYFLYEIIKITHAILPQLAPSKAEKNEINEKIFRQWVFWMGKRRSEIPKRIQIKLFLLILRHDFKFVWRIVRWPIDKLI